MLKAIFIFIGAPGSGKGTIAKFCVERLDFFQLSTGDLFRKHIAEQTLLGQRIDNVIKAGKLVDDATTTEMVTNWFEKESEKYLSVILDGYPRTKIQAELFDKFMKENHPGVDVHVVKFEVLVEEIIARLNSRVICKNKNCQKIYSTRTNSFKISTDSMKCKVCGADVVHRKDDAPEVVRNRLEVYSKHENVLLEFYKEIGQPVVGLDVNCPPEKVFDKFKKAFSIEGE